MKEKQKLQEYSFLTTCQNPVAITDEATKDFKLRIIEDVEDIGSNPKIPGKCCFLNKSTEGII